ncbi:MULTISPECIES: hypothetical protein [unclassified Paenibacillus]|uniref:hypothetical protein n=1 Tax=unclassified Paenibacillus TaxID=185978 RepID=UPI0030F9BAD9
MQTKNYQDQNGSRWVVEGTLEISGNGKITKDGREVDLEAGKVSRKEYDALAARVAALEKGGS